MENIKKCIFGHIFDMYQQNGCVRTQLHKNVCSVQKIAVPLHRQKETKEFLKDNELSKKKVGWLQKAD